MKESNKTKITSTGKSVKRKGKKAMWIVIGVVVVLVIAIGGCMIFAMRGIREVQELSINSVSFTNLADGTYEGKYIGVKDHMRDTTVRVTVVGSKVTDIEPVGGSLIKDGKPVELRQGQTIFDLYTRVIGAQSLQVDVISGATLTSKTNLKAVENAVEQAQKK